MSSLLGQIIRNAFMCHIEKILENQNKMTAFYKRYVDDTLSKMSDVSSASEFLLTLVEIHDSFNFTMELEYNGKLPFLRLLIMKNSSRLDTKVYAKPETVVENTIRHFAKMKVTGDTCTKQVSDEHDTEKSANTIRHQLGLMPLSSPFT